MKKSSPEAKLLVSCIEAVRKDNLAMIAWIISQDTTIRKMYLKNEITSHAMERLTNLLAIKRDELIRINADFQMDLMMLKMEGATA